MDERLLALSKPTLLIVDELRYLPLEPDVATHLFFQLVSRRYETGAMLITSNRSAAGWGTVFADPVVATTILDRLLHHSHADQILSPLPRHEHLIGRRFDLAATITEPAFVFLGGLPAQVPSRKWLEFG